MEKLIQDLIADQKTFLLIVGVVFLFLGTLGKFEIKEFKIDLGRLGRLMAFFFGSLFLVIALSSNKPVISPNPSTSNSPTAIKTEEKSQIKSILDNASSALSKGDYISALDLYNNALEIQKDSPDAWNGLGAARENLGQVLPAIEAYKKAVKLNDKDPNFAKNLGNALIRIKRYQDAINPLELATQLAPNLPEAWTSYGIAKCHIQQYPESVKAFEKSSNLSKDSVNESYLKKAIQARDANNSNLCPIP